MANVSISKAIELSGVSRATFYKKYLGQGLITVSKDHQNKKFIETSELIRVFGKLTGSDECIQSDIQKDDEKNNIRQLNSQLKQDFIQLGKQLELSNLRVEELQADKSWYQSELSKLTDTIKLLEHRQEQELDTPPEPSSSDEVLKSELAELRQSINQLSGRRWYQFWK